MLIAGRTRRGALRAGLALALGGPAFGREPEPPKGKARAIAPWQTLPPTPKLPQETKREVVALRSGARIAYAVFGTGGDPVLFLHGGMGSSAHWANQIEHLRGRFLVIAMDTRGHGRSPVTSGMSFGFDRFAADVDALLDHLGIPAASLVGWSDGGITGLRLAMTKPARVRRLFSFGANVTPAGLIAGGSKAATFARYVAECKATYPDPARWPDLMAGLGPMWKREPNFSKAQLAAVKAPTTVAYADHDEIIRPGHAKSIAADIRAGRAVALADVSHFAMLQDPARFNAALDEFLTI